MGAVYKNIMPKGCTQINRLKANSDCNADYLCQLFRNYTINAEYLKVASKTVFT